MQPTNLVTAATSSLVALQPRMTSLDSITISLKTILTFQKPSLVRCHIAFFLVLSPTCPLLRSATYLITGRDVQFERYKSGDLRLGGISKSYADHLLIIGDAAGFIDPLTGEGIQYAMESGMYAANVIDEGIKRGNLSEAFLKKYQDIWYADWGREFVWSMNMSLFLYRFPIFLDGAAKLINRRGARFLADWAEVMTGSQSKIWFLRPDVGPLIVLEALGIFIGRLFGKK